MILVDREIRNAVKEQHLLIRNFDESGVQPASYDLRIGNLVYAPPNPDQPLDLSTDGGFYRLPPYGNAVLTTHEDLKLPDDMAGHIGLKSGLARRGLFASTGPQIDPGFEGKLFVSVFNLTATSQLLKYLDTFLTVEFHGLESKPEKTYQGPYQGKYTAGAEVIDPLVRLEGVSLSQMQAQFTELQQHVKEWANFAGRFDEFLTELRKHTEAIARLTAAEGDDRSPLEARRLSLQQAMDEVLRLFREKKRLFYSDIMEALQLDLGTVVKACDELTRKGLIEGAQNGQGRAKKTRRQSSPRAR